MFRNLFQNARAAASRTAARITGGRIGNRGATPNTRARQAAPASRDQYVGANAG